MIDGDLVYCPTGIFYDEADKIAPFIIRKLTPIQMPSLDIEEVKHARAHFTDDEWIDLVLRSTGMEPSQFNKRVKWCIWLD